MSVIIPSALTGQPGAGTAAAPGQTMYSLSVGAAFEDANYTYATRLRWLWGRGYAVLTSLTTAQTLATEVPIRTSVAGDLVVQVETTGATAEVTVAVAGLGSVTLSGAGVLTGTIAGAAADTGYVVSVTYRSTSGVGLISLRSTAIYEADITAL